VFSGRSCITHSSENMIQTKIGTAVPCTHPAFGGMKDVSDV